MPEHITIIGGGVAGLALGIGLRRQGVPTTVWEAGHYPRHRVCGEFISGRGQESLLRLGLQEGLQKAGVRRATSAVFMCGKNAGTVRALPEAAWCVSRFVLDAWLAREFERLGGELRTGDRWTGGYGAGIVRATGRRPEAVTEGWRLFGLKAHAHRVRLSADLEMHLVPAGYVGLCRLPGDAVNLCGLFRSREPVPDLAAHWRSWLAGPAGSTLHRRLAGAELEENSFCAVAGLSLRPRPALSHEEFCVGDALTMTPPVTGNGMSMAFESAELALGPLSRFSRGRLTWIEARHEAATACDRRFARRLRWAARLQRGLFHPPVRAVVLFCTARSGRLWRALFALTR